MILDNIIDSHPFHFMDLALFPDVLGEYRNDRDSDLGGLYRAFSKSDWYSFQEELNALIEHTYADVSRSSVEVELAQQWMNRLRSYFHYYTNEPRFVRQKSQANHYSDLYEQGASVFNIDNVSIQNALSSEITRLQNLPNKPTSPGDYDRGVMVDKLALNKISGIIHKAGVTSVASLYAGREIKVTNAFLHVGRPGDTHWKQFLQDCKTLPILTNTHIDPKEDAIKALIYLSDVDLESGPFSYVPFSHRFKLDPLQNIFGRAISTGSYCYNKASRASVFRLPAFLRVSHNFGRTLLNETPLAEWLLNERVVVTSDMGNCIVFDSGKCIHQGGICSDKERIAIQVLMK